MNKINKLIWKFPSWVHDLILWFTGWRLVETKVINQVDQYGYSLSKNQWEVIGYITQEDRVLKWHKTYPL